MLKILDEEDVKLQAEGHPLFARTLMLKERVCNRLGVNIFLYGGPISSDEKRINNALEKIYPKEDRVLNHHVGIVVWEQFIFKVTVPTVLGRRPIIPMDHIEIPEVQRIRIEKDDYSLKHILDQFGDIFDMDKQYQGLNGSLQYGERVQSWFDNARGYLCTATAALSDRTGQNGAVQSGVIATELALKTGLIAAGKSEEQCRKEYGHDTQKIIKDLPIYFPNLDVARILRTISSWPELVGDKYNPVRRTTEEAAVIVAGAQYVSAEVSRQIFGNCFRDRASKRWERVFPA